VLKNYAKVAVRNIFKHRLYSFINIGGLAVGVACTLLIFLWVRDETGFDRFHRNADSLYRLNWDFKWRGNEGLGPGTPPPLGAALAKNIPEVESATRVYPVSRMIVRREDKFFSEGRIFGVDPSFFDLFTFPLLSGDPKTALAEPNSVILTEATARRYFGDKPALGALLTIGEANQTWKKPYRNVFLVTGIVQNPPRNSHLQFDLLTSIASHPEVEYFDWSWVWMQVVTYAKIREGVSPAVVEAKIPGLVKTFGSGSFKRVGFSYEQLMAGGGHWNFRLQPLKDVYLGSVAIGNRLGPLGNRVYVYLFSIIALFVLGIACINFMNLATARSASRAKEVGLRKVLGSEKKRLIGQFLVESQTASFLAMPLALLLVELAIGPFNRLSGKAIEFRLTSPAWMPAALLGLALLVGFVAGSYPGFYLSSFVPAEVLKGTFRAGRKSRRLRHLLVVLQFTLTIALIACTLLVRRQMEFFQRADLGFSRAGIVTINNENSRLGTRAEAFREKLCLYGQIAAASISSGAPPDEGFQDSYKAEGQGENQSQINSYLTDEYFLDTLGLRMAQGRGFSRDFEDAGSVVLNETAVKAFGLADPIGKTVFYPGAGSRGRGQYKVIGVMKDFNFMTLQSPIMPLALFHAASNSYTTAGSVVIVRLKPGEWKRGLEIIASEWKSFAPSTPFEYAFLDDSLNALYLSEQRLGKVFLVFSALAILIACVGLVGLAAFATEQRTREIGVRKVLGASSGSVVGLLIKDFVRLVLLSNLLAWPIAWFAMRRWLENFAYHAHMTLGSLVLAGAIALSIAVASVGASAIRAAGEDPVDALKYE
jgi:putative ABC transport system permease protein